MTSIAGNIPTNASYWIGAVTHELKDLLLNDNPDKELIAKALVGHMEDEGCEIPSLVDLKKHLKEKYNI